MVNPKKSETNNLPNDYPVSFLPMEKIGEDGSLILDENKNLDDVKAGFTYFKNEDIIIAKITPCFENGKGSLCQNLKNGIGFGTTELHVLRAYDEYERNFMYYWTRSNPFMQIGESMMYGSAGQKRVPTEFIQEFMITHPKLKQEQQQISDFLDSQTKLIESQIESNQKLVTLLQEKRQATINHAVTKGLDPTVPMKDSGIEWIGEIPEHWGVKRLKLVTECLDYRRIPLNSDERSDRTGPYPYYGASGLVDYVDDYIFNEKLVCLAEDGENLHSRALPISFMIDGKTWVNNHAHVLRSLIDPEFLVYLLNSIDLLPFIEGATRMKLTQDNMNNLILQLPKTIQEQKQISDYLDKQISKIDSLISKTQIQIEKLQEFRQSLISAAVTGKIDVRKEVIA
jgi:restriction endonuclease S subunit